MKLLLVEDDPKVVAYLTRGLSEEGFVVESCSDGEVALDIATSDDHDLIILDVLLPMMNGWTFLKRFRQFKVKWMDKPIKDATCERGNEKERKIYY